MDYVPFLDEYRDTALSSPHGEQRLKVLQEAWEWLFTPWRHESRVKGAGVDCGNFVSAVFANTGLIQLPPLLKYPHDFYLHSDKELFLEELEKFCSKMPEPSLPASPADIVGFKIGKPTVAHVAIVVKWPLVIHSHRQAGNVTLDSVILGPLLRAFSGTWRLKDWCTE